MCLHDTTDLSKMVTLSLASDTTSSSCFVVNHDLTVPRIGGYLVQTLCNVFMCYVFNREPRIYNPTTRQLVTLPEAIKTSKPIPGQCAVTVFYYFGYDPVTDQYKVVCSTGVLLVKYTDQIKSEHWVFVLKGRGGRVWKKLAPTQVDFLPHIPARGGVCIDGVIYYLGWTNKYYPTLLVSFHIGSEDLKMIRIPTMDWNDPTFNMPLSERMRNVSLIECSGKVAIINQSNVREYGLMYLWSLEDVGKENWCWKIFCVQSSQQHLVDKNTLYNVRGTTQDGKVLFIPKNLFTPFHILSFDLGSSDMRKIEIKGVPDHWFRNDKSTIVLALMDLNESFRFLET